MFETKIKAPTQNIKDDSLDILEPFQDTILFPQEEVSFTKQSNLVLSCNQEDSKQQFDSFESFQSFVEKDSKTHSQRQFDPYEDNSGTALSITHDDFIIVAADTRHASEMGINSRTCSKIFRIKDFLFSVTGFFADGLELYNVLSYEVELYEALGPIDVHALACLASKLMYSRRFFPYFVYATISGFDNGKPYVYRYDCVGGYESVKIICNGSGAPLIQPLLDSFIEFKNWHGDKPVIDREYALKIVLKAFDAASERDVKTGDALEVYIMTKDEIKRDVLPLRRD
ncbi:putative proteasome subunit beta type-6 [Nosema granulosis]|uniref:Proteasome subunit beta type-6 n=1 Tax=Nosema granulosis TaxID=83296 RepID=A0A9P6KZP8_9MICR|nr:putative proteasome subunit beta type-6 [Nosema granulosis]